VRYLTTTETIHQNITLKVAGLLAKTCWWKYYK